VDGHHAPVSLSGPRQEHLGSVLSDIMYHRSMCLCSEVKACTQASDEQRGCPPDDHVSAGDKGLYTAYICQLMSCIASNIAMQLACALAIKVGD
jgi:hypothetical protein